MVLQNKRNGYYSLLYNTKETYSIFIALLVFFQLFSGCASPRFLAVPNESVSVTPNRTFAISGKEGIVVSVSHIKTPKSIRQITTFNVEILNNSGTAVEFFPKPYLLLDQDGAQYISMGPDAIAEASASERYSGGYIGLGFGHGYHHGRHHSYYYHQPVPYYSSYSYGRFYSGMLAKALPVRPMTIHPYSKINGNVYFAVNPNHLSNVELILTRFIEMPVRDQPVPREIEYRFNFAVIKN